MASGTIIKCEDVNGTYSSSILTCASLLRPSTDSNTMGDNIKVVKLVVKVFSMIRCCLISFIVLKTGWLLIILGLSSGWQII